MLPILLYFMNVSICFSRIVGIVSRIAFLVVNNICFSRIVRIVSRIVFLVVKNNKY